LNSLDLPGMPLHVLTLKNCVPIILLRNINPSRLCTGGTRFSVKKMMNNIIEATIFSMKNSKEKMKEWKRQKKTFLVKKYNLSKIANFWLVLKIVEHFLEKILYFCGFYETKTFSFVKSLIFREKTIFWLLIYDVKIHYTDLFNTAF
jgi:hypothetical protein